MRRLPRVSGHRGDVLGASEAGARSPRSCFSNRRRGAPFEDTPTSPPPILPADWNAYELDFNAVTFPALARAFLLVSVFVCAWGTAAALSRSSRQIVVRGNDGSWSYAGAGSAEGKQAHLSSAFEELAMKVGGLSGDGVLVTRASTLLIDDDPANVHAALRNGIRQGGFANILSAAERSLSSRWSARAHLHLTKFFFFFSLLLFTFLSYSALRLSGLIRRVRACAVFVFVRQRRRQCF